MSVGIKLMRKIVRDDLIKIEETIRDWELHNEELEREHKGVDEEEWKTREDYENDGHLYGIYENKKYIKGLLELLTDEEEK